MIADILFYVFSTVLLVSGMAVISARNPVHAVLFLILAFFNAAGLFLLLGAEFLAFILAIVYVGAVAVLFLFVVMMLDVGAKDLRQGLKHSLPMGWSIVFVLGLELALMASSWVHDPKIVKAAKDIDNTKALGQLLYTDYFFPFQMSGLILLVAMIGAIVLTQRERKDVRRQRLLQQLNREASEVIEVVKVESGKGVV